jgi:predicted ester cyclase
MNQPQRLTTYMEANKKVVKSYTENIINTGNVSNISSFISPDYAEVYQNKRFILGIEGAKQHILGVRETYPDLNLSIERQLADGDWVITTYTMTGTHLGNWMGIKPTGKKIQVTGVNIDKVIEGKIVEHGGAANLFESLLEIGAIEIKK